MDELNTRASLLMRMRDVEDAAAWSEFVDLYGPIVFSFCIKRGLSKPDVEDTVQEVMRRLARSMQKFEYDPEKGTFRSWLFRITRNVLATRFSKMQREPQMVESQTVVARLEDENAGEEKEWELEYRRQMFSWAAERVKTQVTEQSWNAFWMTAVDEKDPETVAEELGIQVGSVYTAKSRVIARMRDEVEKVTGSWDSGLSVI